MVFLRMTSAIVEGIEYMERHGEATGVERCNSDPRANPSVGKSITHDEVIELSRALRAKVKDASSATAEAVPAYRLDDLLKGAQIHVETPPTKAEPTPAYQALMARLRREEEDRAYERMIHPPPPTETFAQRYPGSQGAELFTASKADLGDDEEISFADVNRQMALIINILVSIVACSVSLWLVARHWSTPSRLALSMFGSIAVAVAEAVVYAGYIRRLTEAREEGKKEIEVKEILKTWIIGDGNRDHDQDDTVPIEEKSSTNTTARRRGRGEQELSPT